MKGIVDATKATAGLGQDPAAELALWSFNLWPWRLGQGDEVFLSLAQAGMYVILNHPKASMSVTPEPGESCGRLNPAKAVGFALLHWKVLLWFYAVFALLTFVLMLPGAITGRGEPLRNGMVAAVLALSGPFTGVISRGHWTCSGCRAFAMQMLPYCGAALTAAFLFQLVPFPRPVRISAWVLGLLGWFAGTLLSLLFANS